MQTNVEQAALSQMIRDARVEEEERTKAEAEAEETSRSERVRSMVELTSQAWNRDFTADLREVLLLEWGDFAFPNHEGGEQSSLSAIFTYSNIRIQVQPAMTHGKQLLDPGHWYLDFVNAFGRGADHLLEVDVMTTGGPPATPEETAKAVALRTRQFLTQLDAIEERYKESVVLKEAREREGRMTSSRFKSHTVSGAGLERLMNELDFDQFAIDPVRGGHIFQEGFHEKTGKWMYRIVAVAKGATPDVRE